MGVDPDSRHTTSVALRWEESESAIHAPPGGGRDVWPNRRVGTENVAGEIAACVGPRSARCQGRRRHVCGAFWLRSWTTERRLDLAELAVCIAGCRSERDTKSAGPHFAMAATAVFGRSRDWPRRAGRRDMLAWSAQGWLGVRHSFGLTNLCLPPIGKLRPRWRRTRRLRKAARLTNNVHLSARSVS